MNEQNNGRMSMRKLTFTGVVALLLLLALTGCGKTPGSLTGVIGDKKR
jgi:hypothetical protein